LIAAGTAALPQQIEAFEKYYEANTPLLADRLIAVDEIILSGNAPYSLPVMCNFGCNDRIVMPVGVNLFGGIMRWSAMADQKIIVAEADFFWDIKHGAPKDDNPNAEFDFRTFSGQISYVGSNLHREYVRITKPRGSIIDP
jgi:hypothetical protein